MNEDSQWLAEFCRQNSEAAFQRLVERHLPLVFSTAMRHVQGDAHQAEDICQAVFSNLAGKAKSLPADVVLAGWLHRDTRFKALEFLRKERRRTQREIETAIMQQLQSSTPDEDWTQLRPVLDEVLDELPDEDRHALLLRYFEQQNLAQVGIKLGLAEDTARKRVSRALDKLRHALGLRGITTTSSALSMVLAARGVEVVPLHLGQRLARTGFASAAAASTQLGWVFALLNSLKSSPILAVSVAVIVLGGLVLPSYLSNKQSPAVPIATKEPPSIPVAETGEAAPAPLVLATRPSSRSATGPSVEDLLARLNVVLHEPERLQRTPDPAVKEAMEAFGAQRAAAIPMLRAALSESSMQVVRRAMHGLGLIRLEAKEAVPEVLAMMRGTTASVVLGDGFWMLRAMGPMPEILPDLVTILRSRPGENISIADGILVAAGDDAQLLLATMTPLLQEPLPAHRGDPLMDANRNRMIREAAAYSLSRVLHQQAGSEVVKAAIEALISTNVNSEHLGLATIRNVTSNPSEQPQAVNARYLGSNAAEVMAALTQVVNTSALEDRRIRALKLLDELDPQLRRQNPDLQTWRSGQDQQEEFRRRTLTGQATLPELIAGLKQYPGATPNAADAIGRLGTEARTALPALREVFDSLQPAPGTSALDRTAVYASREKVANAIHRLAPESPRVLFTEADMHRFDNINEEIVKAGDIARLENIAPVFRAFLAEVPSRRKQLTPDEMRALLSLLEPVDRAYHDSFLAKAKAIDPHFELVKSP